MFEPYIDRGGLGGGFLLSPPAAFCLTILTLYRSRASFLAVEVYFFFVGVP